MIERRKFKRYICDRRKFERYNIEIPVSVEIMLPIGLPGKIDFEGINLAAGGILIKNGYSLPKGPPIKMQIIFHFEDLKSPENLEGALIMTVTGHVLRIEPEGTAIGFDEDYEMSQSLSFLQKENKKRSFDKDISDYGKRDYPGPGFVKEDQSIERLKTICEHFVQSREKFPARTAHDIPKYWQRIT